jgi:hypothetical protein
VALLSMWVQSGGVLVVQAALVGFFGGGGGLHATQSVRGRAAGGLQLY